MGSDRSQHSKQVNTSDLPVRGLQTVLRSWSGAGFTIRVDTLVSLLGSVPPEDLAVENAWSMSDVRRRSHRVLWDRVADDLNALPGPRRVETSHAFHLNYPSSPHDRAGWFGGLAGYRNPQSRLATTDGDGQRALRHPTPRTTP